MKTLLLALTLATTSTSALATDAWKYVTEIDQTDGSKVKYGLLKSDNSLSLTFPYAGLNYGRLQIRERKADGVRVIFAVDKGQVACRGGANRNSCTVQVRFDEAQPVDFKATGPSDSDLKVLFLAPERRFVDQAMKAKKIRIAVDLYQNGTSVLEFNTPTPLTWDASKPATNARTHPSQP